MTTIEDYYEVNQIATKGPIFPFSRGLTLRDHLVALCGWLALLITTSFIVYYNLTILYRFNPDYGKDFEMERAFCLEVIDKQFVSRYEWVEEEMICKKVGSEVNSAH